jgi:hypothetical protein
MKSRLSLLITYARCQRSVAYMVAGGAMNIRKGVWTGKEALRKTRWVNYHKADIEQRAQCMREVVKCRLEDVEENGNKKLLEAIDRLSAARLNRIEYAGRVLP